MPIQAKAMIIPDNKIRQKARTVATNAAPENQSGNVTIHQDQATAPASFIEMNTKNIANGNPVILHIFIFFIIILDC